MHASYKKWAEPEKTRSFMEKKIHTIGAFVALCTLLLSSIAQARDPDLHIAYPPGLFTNVDVKDAQAAVVVWSKALTTQWGLPFGLVPSSYNDVDALVAPLRQGTLDMVALFPLDYLKLKDRLNIEPVVVPSFHGSTTYRTVLLTRRDRQISDWQDLRDRQIAITRASRGDIVNIWMEVALLRRDLAPSSAFFRQVRSVDKTAQAVLLVFLEKADACLVPTDQFATMVELNPQLGRELIVVDTSPETCYGLICQRPGFDQTLCADLERHLTQLHEEALGQQILTLFHYGQLRPYDPVYMEETMQLLAEYKTLRTAQGDNR
ncbi:MAG: ABC-type phosphate/phosphonate transport system substrate-binding protein [Candidatus Latescibacterota bacterium]